MRIAMVHSTFAVRGGAEHYLEDITAGLTARGHRVELFSRDGHRPRISGRRLLHLGDLIDPTGPALRGLPGFAPDVVHVHNWQGLGVLPLARIARRFPTVHTVHDHAVLDPNNALGNLGRSAALDLLLGLRRRWITRHLRRMTLLFAAEHTRRRIRADPRDRVLPPGLDPRWLRLEWPAGPRDTFLFLGALSPHKGLDLLLDAWSPEMGTLLVAGDGPLRETVEERAAADPSVRYLGYLDEAGKRAAFERCGWFVFPSRGAETYGLAAAEALAAGRPVIAAVRVRPPAASDPSLLLFRKPGELAVVLRRAAGLDPAEHARKAASAARDGSRLDRERHLDELVGIYASAAS
jgi:glycosyltransferase involved in cell wall biosynthesis